MRFRLEAGQIQLSAKRPSVWERHTRWRKFIPFLKCHKSSRGPVFILFKSAGTRSKQKKRSCKTASLQHFAPNEREPERLSGDRVNHVKSIRLCIGKSEEDSEEDSEESSRILHVLHGYFTKSIVWISKYETHETLDYVAKSLAGLLTEWLNRWPNFWQNCWPNNWNQRTRAATIRRPKVAANVHLGRKRLDIEHMLDSRTNCSMCARRSLRSACRSLWVAFQFQDSISRPTPFKV